MYIDIKKKRIMQQVARDYWDPLQILDSGVNWTVQRMRVICVSGGTRLHLGSYALLSYIHMLYSPAISFFTPVTQMGLHMYIPYTLFNVHGAALSRISMMSLCDCFILQSMNFISFMELLFESTFCI